MPNILEMIDKFLNLKFAGELTVEVVCFRLLLAIILGGIVGYEREKNNRPAGFRTHILVCFGAAIVSMVQDQLRLNILDLARTEGTAVASVIKTDLGRLGAQVISGVGFLGAGSIMKEKGETVGGMTTAAGIWATGCAGLGIGWGFYNLAIPAIVFMLVIIVIFKKFEPKIVKKTRLLKFEVKFMENQNYAKGLLATYEVFNQKLIKITQIDKNEAENTAIFTVNMDEKIDISDVIVSLSAIKAVEVVKENYN
mgnify:CR=1 FL=1